MKTNEELESVTNNSSSEIPTRKIIAEDTLDEETTVLTNDTSEDEDTTVLTAEDPDAKDEDTTVLTIEDTDIKDEDTILTINTSEDEDTTVLIIEEPEVKDEDTTVLTSEPIEDAATTVLVAEESPIEDDKIIIDTNGIAKAKKKKKIIKILVITFISLVLLAYFGFVVFFSGHYFFDTKIAGVDVSLMSIDEARDVVTDKYNNYQLNINEIDGDTQVIRGLDGDIKISFAEGFTKIKKKQNPFLWLFYGFNAYQYEINTDVTYDKDKLDAFILALSCLEEENIVQPENATLKFEEDKFVIVDAVDGSLIDKDKFIQAVNQAVTNAESVLVLDDAGVYVKPTIYKDATEVTQGLETLNGYMKSKIVYRLDALEIPITKEEMSKWFTISDDYKVSLDNYEITQFVNDFANEYDTVDSERTFTTSKKKTITIKGDSFGWKIDRAAEVEALYDVLADGGSIYREPVFTQTAFAYNEENDIGDTYIECDLTNQHLYCYIDGELVYNSDLVSGCVAQGHTTPGGLYQIYYKALNATLRGPRRPDGSFSYESPVSYWMPFNEGIGLHDARWRSEFGGDIYLKSGSHGCVNLPKATAAFLYENYDVGTPVICYYYE